MTVEFAGKPYKASLVDGKAVITIPNVNKGIYTVPVVYSGSGIYASAANSTSFTVNNTLVPKPGLVETESEKKKSIIVMDFYDGTYYVVRAYDDYGLPVPAGEVIGFHINGRDYNGITNNNGYAKLKINLNPGTYTITARYHNMSISKNIKVKQTLKLVKKTVSVKKGKKLVLKAKLAWTLKSNKGKSLKGKKIVFKFKGKKYSAKTNSKGIAKVTIKTKVTKKLKAGKKYSFSATYVSNTVKGKVKVKK